MLKIVSKVIQRLKPEDRVTVRIDAAEVPLHICLATMGDIGDELRNYQENLAIEVGDILLVQDAP